MVVDPVGVVPVSTLGVVTVGTLGMVTVGGKLVDPVGVIDVVGLVLVVGVPAVVVEAGVVGQLYMFMSLSASASLIPSLWPKQSHFCKNIVHYHL